ncbi:conserved hypothetical protein [Trichinella spiralis]|uniref:hypothetical protein n=1 Tax=Trichinella spiralis TaxID=6334 RepID=UPI0001EFB4EC|nr:conserved hypothetical protein [Trichinella spiralis]
MNMGGIDLNNMLAALYRIEHKSRKWTRRIFFWIISTAMTNAWQLYKRDRKEMPGTCTGTLDLLSFTCQNFINNYLPANYCMPAYIRTISVCTISYRNVYSFEAQCINFDTALKMAIILFKQ